VVENMSVNVLDAKQKIVNFILQRGPSLPVHLTKVTEMNLTFTSAILAELLSEKKIKLSNLRVGTSPLYYILGQEEKLEAFVDNLKEPEVEAFRKLKQNKILDDEKQSPVLRVALRSIKDFAIPLKSEGKLYWKYYLLSNEKASLAISEHDEKVEAIGSERVLGQQIWDDIQKQKLSKERIEEMVKKQVEEITNKMKQEALEKSIEKKESEKELVLEKTEEKFHDIEIKTETKPKKIARVSTKQKKKPLKDIFLEDAVSQLALKNIEIIEILKVDTNKLIARVKSIEEFLVIFTKKKRLEEKEILRDLKKYNSSNLDVKILLGGEPSKKISEKIEILGRIKDIQKIQEQ
jgi:hypothetical protein